MLFVVIPQFCISIVFSFPWGHFNSQEKLKTMLMQNCGVTIKEHYGMFWYFLEWSIDVRANTQGRTAVGNATKEAMSVIRTREPMLGLVGRSTIPPNLLVPQATTNHEFAGSLPTPINVNRFEIALADHPNRGFVSNLLQTFRLGANIGFFG